jgi:Kef-type K+ transport system membrane component KefB
MTQPFSAASHHDILVLLVQFTLLLFTARVMGEIAQRLGQPTVVGELLAGILLGPSLISGLFPALGEWIVPHTPTQGYLLELIALIGAMFMLLITGLETDLSLIRRQARTAIGVSVGGITVTFITGFALGQMLPDDLLADPSKRLVFSLFVATAMSISAIPVIAKVLFDLGLIRRDVGQTIIAAGMSDDTVGWILLSVVAGLAAGEAVTVASVLVSVAKVLAFMLLSFTAGSWLVKRLLRLVTDSFNVRDRVLSLVIVMTFAWGAITQTLNLEAVLGAFVMGILFGRTRMVPVDVIHTIEKIAMGIFAPVFFAVAGLKVNIGNLLQPRLIVITLVVIAVATGGKVIGTYLGARLIGRKDHWNALSYGAGLNARGAMEIIIATIGLSLGILTQDMFSIIVVMAMATSLMAPFALRWVLSHVEPTAEEAARLRQEELAQHSLLANVRRVLLPVRVRLDGSPYSTIEARILERLNARARLSVTLMTVTKPESRAEGIAFLDKLAGAFSAEPVTKKVVIGDNTGGLILDEAQRGDYGLMVIGAPQGITGSEVLFTPIVDFLMRTAPCPTLLVHGQADESWTPRHVLIATNGSTASKRAAEVGFALAGPEGEAILMQVVERTGVDFRFDASGELYNRQYTIAERGIDELRELGELQQVTTSAEVRGHRSPDQAIVERARELSVDLIVLGTSIRVGGERLYLGPRVERILANAPCPVVVVNS